MCKLTVIIHKTLEIMNVKLHMALVTSRAVCRVTVIIHNDAGMNVN